MGRLPSRDLARRVAQQGRDVDQRRRAGAVFFALGFYVYREFSWDAHWEDAERIYRASASQENANGNTPAVLSFGPWVLGTALQSRHPDAFETYVRVYNSQHVVTAAGNDFPGIGKYLAEPALLELLQFETHDGSLADVFADPSAIALHRRMAEQFFGNRSPLGETITFSAQGGPFGAPTRDFVVKAVFTLQEPTNFFITTLGLLSPDALPVPNARLDAWQVVPQRMPQPNQPPPPPPEQPLSVQHYFKVREGTDVKALEADLRTFMDENRYLEFGNTRQRYFFQNMRDVHLIPTPFEPGDSVARLMVYAAIGVLVLVISGCNFVMLATLRLVDRMREVGIRKSAGAGAGQLMGQYLLDAFLHVFVAALVAVLLLAFGLPQMQTILQFPELDLLRWRNLGLCLAMVVIFTLASSLYSTWTASHSKPAPLLRNGAGAVVGTGTALRRLLVGIQFAIVVVLLLATAVVRQQIDYTRQRDPGYSLENVVQVRGVGTGVFQRSDALLAALRNSPGVVSAAAATITPGVFFLSAPTMVRTLVMDGASRQAGIQALNAGSDFFRTMSVRILAGREFSDEFDAGTVAEPGVPQADTSGPLPERRIVLNESAARLLGFATPDAAVEQLLETEVAQPGQPPRMQTLRVIGVVADTQFSSAMLPPVPQYYMYQPRTSLFIVKLEPGVDLEAATSELRAVWNSIVPGEEFRTQDSAAATAFQFRREEFEARIITGSTALAIIIALLGLYGLVAATVVKRVKEIGVRKVMGAERRNIVTLFLWQFSKPIVVANLIAWPFGFWAIRQWLTRFPYQLDTFVIVMSGLAASLVALLIAWLTVGAMAARAASVNPVKALRYE